MEEGTRTPTPTGRAHRLLALAAAAACWLAVPAGASAEQAHGLDVSGLTTAAAGAVASTGSAVESTVTAAAPPAGPAEGAVTQVAGTVARVTGPAGPVARVGAGTAEATGSVARQVTGATAPVAGAVDRVVPEARRAIDDMRHGVAAVDETLRGVTAVDQTLRGVPPVDETLRRATGPARESVRDSGPAGAAAGQGSPRVERLPGPAAGPETSRASRLRLHGTAVSGDPAATLPGAPGEPSSPILIPLIPGPSIGLTGTPAGGGDIGSAAAAAGALELPSHTEPISGAAGGSGAAGASVSFSLGGLALLLATLSLAGPALRRRLPRRPVIGWPAAFVPLLERPG